METHFSSLFAQVMEGESRPAERQSSQSKGDQPLPSAPLRGSRVARDQFFGTAFASTFSTIKLCAKTHVERGTKIALSHAKLAEDQSRKGAGVTRCGVSQMWPRDPPC